MKTKTVAILGAAISGGALALAFAFGAIGVPEIAQIIPSIDPHIIPSIDPHIIPSIDPHIIPSIDPHIIPSIDPHIIPSIDPHAILG